jgi:hypothetical protein
MTEFDFEKNKTVSDLQSVPQEFQGLYVEGQNEEGEAVFSISDAAQPLVKAYVGTTKSLNSTRADKKKVSDENAQRRLATKAFDEIAEALGLEVGDDGVAAALKAHVDELMSKVKGGEELKVDLDKVRREMKAQAEEALAAKDTEIQERDTALSRHLISDVATRELAAASGSIELLLPHVESQCKVFRTEEGKREVRVLDADGDARTNGAGGYMDVKELIAEMKAQNKFARGFDSDEKPGTGVQPGIGKKSSTSMKRGEPKTSVDKISAGLNQRLGGRR